MLVLLDTGILVRLLHRTDPHYQGIRHTLSLLRHEQDEHVTSPQNMAEFWNVCTRPPQERGGFGLSVHETSRRLHLLEDVFRVLPDTLAAYSLWKELVLRHVVQGKQAHDARLVALMMVHGITHLLTLNPNHFSRYPGITALTPVSAPL
jgi:predicted nucleic acid-binding protein